MRHIVCITLLMVAASVAAPAHAAPLILTLAEAQIETSPDPNARPPKPGRPAPAQQPASDFPPLQEPEVITPIGTGDSTTTTTTTKTIEPAVKKSSGGGLTAIQWVGIGVAVIAVGALAAAGGGGDEPVPQSSGSN